MRKQEWVFLLFSPDSDDRLNLNFHRFVILYIHVSCDTRSVGFGQYCLPKVYNGFKQWHMKQIVKVNYLTDAFIMLLKGLAGFSSSSFIFSSFVEKKTWIALYTVWLLQYESIIITWQKLWMHSFVAKSGSLSILIPYAYYTCM